MGKTNITTTKNKQTNTTKTNKLKNNSKKKWPLPSRRRPMASISGGSSGTSSDTAAAGRAVNTFTMSALTLTSKLKGWWAGLEPKSESVHIQANEYVIWKQHTTNHQLKGVFTPIKRCSVICKKIHRRISTLKEIRKKKEHVFAYHRAGCGCALSAKK